MKSIIELYNTLKEDAAGCGPGACTGVSSTTGNTMGMGNPMAPNGSDCGSEPMTAKCKKQKRKKSNKSDVVIEKSLLDDNLDGVLAQGDADYDKYKFAKYLVENQLKHIGAKIKGDVKSIVPFVMEAIDNPSKGLFIVDIDKFYKTADKSGFLIDRLYVNEAGWPDYVKTIKVVNGKYGIDIPSYTENISKVDIECYSEGDGSKPAELKIMFGRDTKRFVKLGNILCDELRLYGKHVHSVAIGGKSQLNKLDFSDMENLNMIKCNPLDVERARLPKSYIRKILYNAGISKIDAAIEIMGF